jgi:hypothetical protein
MSIFHFLKEMFFGRTEKSGTEIIIICRSENGKKQKHFNNKKMQKNEKIEEPPRIKIHRSKKLSDF